MNLSQQKRERLLNFIKELKSNNSFDEKSLIELNEIENELNGKKYGLVWEEHEEAVDVQMKEAVPVFAEDKSKEIIGDKEAPYNFLLEGDNLHSLYLLEKTHKGKIDVIYIDPPYNTGSEDFIYDDKYVSADDTFRHSKWLSFMKKRLEIGFKLLTNKGVVFISIDDNELYALKLLCDELFGIDNYISTLTIESGEVFGTKAAHADKTFVKVKDYVLVYAKNKRYVTNKKPLYDKMNDLYDSHYNTIINDKLQKIKFSDYIKQVSWVDEKINRLNLKLNFDTINKLLNEDEEFREKFYSEIAPILYTDQPMTKKVDNDIINSMEIGKVYELDNKLVYRTAGNTIRIYQSFLNCLHETDDYNSIYSRSSIRGDLWKNFHIDMRNIDDEGSVKFKSGKKPVRLILQLLKWCNVKDAIVLDFFAGSGSTAEAVIRINKKDDGNRKFILCTNNENGICDDITYKRLQNISNGYSATEPTPYNLKFFRAGFVSKSSKNLSKELTKHVKELIELEWGVSIDKKINLMVMTEEELDKIEANWDKLKTTVKSIYRARQVVYTGKQKQLFKNINNFIIPDYYFNNELKEVGENW